MNKINSLNIALVALMVVAIALVGVSYSRQKKAENHTLALVNAVNSASSLEDLKSTANGFLVYDGSGTKADAARVIGTGPNGDGSMLTCYQAEHGDDAGRIWCEEASNDWWNPFGWFN